MIKKISLSILGIGGAIVSPIALVFLLARLFEKYYSFYSWQFPNWEDSSYAMVSILSILVSLLVYLTILCALFEEKKGESISKCNRCNRGIRKEEESLHKEKKSGNEFWDICEDCIQKVKFL